jgi:hypothetical protein
MIGLNHRYRSGTVVESAGRAFGMTAVAERVSILRHCIHHSGIVKVPDWKAP